MDKQQQHTPATNYQQDPIALQSLENLIQLEAIMHYKKTITSKNEKKQIENAGLKLVY